MPLVIKAITLMRKPLALNMGAEGVSGDRAQALRECEAKAGKFTDYAWGNYQSYQLRACMAEHGQPE